MFTSVGHRPEPPCNACARRHPGAAGWWPSTTQGTSTLATEDSNVEPITLATARRYACPNVATHDRQVRLNIPSPGSMRAPGTVEGNFALESALDELSYELRIDPIELRLRNYAEVHPQSGLPWSSNALRECYRVGAERFGWAARNPEIGSMRDGNWLVGYGMAGGIYHWYQAPCQARVTINARRHGPVRSAATDIGTGTYTVATQLAAELLGLDIDQVHVELGDSDLPPHRSPAARGWPSSLGGAIHAAAGNLAASVPRPRRRRRPVAPARPTIPTRSPSPTAASTSSTTPRSASPTPTSWPATGWTS